MDNYYYDSSSDSGYAECTFINGALGFYSSNYSFGSSEPINLSTEESYRLYLTMKEYYERD